MKTTTLLKKAADALTDIMSHTCNDFHDYDNMIDFDACKKALDSLIITHKSYSEDRYRSRAKARQIQERK